LIHSVLEKARIEEWQKMPSFALASAFYWGGGVAGYAPGVYHPLLVSFGHGHGIL
jgi:hypothetical protein